MKRRFKIIKQKESFTPGTITYIGEEKKHQIRMNIISYNEEEFNKTDNQDMDDLRNLQPGNAIHWINVDGIHDVNVIEQIGKIFTIHPLTLEDITNTTQRPKYEEFDDYFYYVIKMIYINPEDKNIKTEQVSLILMKNIVISFQETIGDVFDSIRHRLKNNKGRIRRMKSDYLFYSLIDAIIDNYFTVIEKIGEGIEDIDDELINKSDTDTIHKIHEIKREILFFRKSLWPLRDVNSAIYRLESAFLSEDIRMFLRDLYDHTIQVVDTLETYRDMVTGIMELYMSVTSNKLNEIMKVLTIFASIFIPLTFIAGWYGMNFKHMPELDFPFSYPIIIIIILGCISGMLFYFRKKGWIGKRKNKKL